MKKETREIILNHPELGKVKKKVTYTFDDTKYATLDECLVDHELMEKQKKEECDRINSANEKLIKSTKEKHFECVLEWEKSIADLNTEYQKKIDEIKEEHKGKLIKLDSEKPKLVIPELGRLDSSKYEGRGYVNKEAYSEDVKPDIIKMLLSASDEEKQAIRDLLK